MQLPKPTPIVLALTGAALAIAGRPQLDLRLSLSLLGVFMIGMAVAR